MAAASQPCVTSFTVSTLAGTKHLNLMGTNKPLATGYITSVLRRKYILLKLIEHVQYENQ